MNKATIFTMLIILLLCLSEGRSEAWIFRTKSPVNGQLESVSNDNYRRLIELEFSLFGLAFEGEEIYSRVSRIENRLFRQVNNGMDLNSRISNIFASSNNVVLNGVSPQDLAEVEFRVFKKTYVNDNMDSRFRRLESRIFGAGQSGNYVQRFSLLKSAAENYNNVPQNTFTQTTYPSPVYNSYYPTTTLPVSNSGGWKGFLQNFTNNLMMGGTMTGFTPQYYDPYNNSGFQYSNGGYTQQIRTPYGVQNIFNTTSGGAGVRILP